MATASSEAEPQTEFSSCFRKGRRNACAEIKYCTCEIADKDTGGATKSDPLEEPCPIHADKVDQPNPTADKGT